MADQERTGTPNAHADAFLRYYCDPKRNVGYAVLLTGQWGAGKTYFVREFLNEQNVKYLYVSLYGLTDVAHIDQELFRQAHPILSSKGMRLAGQMAKTALSAALQFNVEVAKDESASVGLSVPNIDVSSYFKTPDDRLLVFDDLERCSISLTDVLGYINAFVEHDEFKVILIGNEAEINAKSESYIRIKEKLIGKTIDIKANIAAALPRIVVEIAGEDDWTKDLLAEAEPEIAGVFAASQTNNIRVLRYALLDAERYLECLTAQQRRHRPTVIQLVRLVLALSIELRIGRLRADEIVGFK